MRSGAAESLETLVDRELLAEEARRQKLQEQPSVKARLAAAPEALPCPVVDNHCHLDLSDGSWAAAERKLPAGPLRIDKSQPLARLAFYLLEPRSDDGLVNWNLLDEGLKDAAVFPIVRSPK